MTDGDTTVQPVHATAGLRLDAQRDQPRTAQHSAYAALRRAILRGELAPGTRLTQADIAHQLAVSTTPVREALRRLAGEGLVRIDAHRGAIVRGLDLTELREVYEVRLLLEPLATGKAALMIAVEELDRADALCDRMDQVMDDPPAWAEANSDFHSVLARGARAPVLEGLLVGLRDSAARYVQLSVDGDHAFAARANDEHRQLVQACRDRDSPRAADIELQHLKGTLAAMTRRAGEDDER